MKAEVGKVHSVLKYGRTYSENISCDACAKRRRQYEQIFEPQSSISLLLKDCCIPNALKSLIEMSSGITENESCV